MKSYNFISLRLAEEDPFKCLIPLSDKAFFKWEARVPLKRDTMRDGKKNRVIGISFYICSAQINIS